MLNFRKSIAFMLIIVLVLSLSGCKISPTLSMGGNGSEVLHTLTHEPEFEDIKENLSSQHNTSEYIALSNNELSNLENFEKLSNQFINEPTKAKNTLNTLIDQNNEEATEEEIEQFKQMFSLIMEMYEYDQRVKEELNIDATIKMKMFGDYALIKDDENINVPYITYLEINSVSKDLPDMTSYAKEGVESIYGDTSVVSELMAGDYDTNTMTNSEEQIQSAIDDLKSTYEMGYKYLLENQGKYLVTEVNLRSFSKTELENYSDADGLSAFFEMQVINDNSMSLDFTEQSPSERELESISKMLEGFNDKESLTEEELKEKSKLEEVYRNIFREQDYLDNISFYGEVKDVSPLDNGTFDVVFIQLPNQVNTIQNFDEKVNVGDKLRVYIEDGMNAKFKTLAKGIEGSTISSWAKPFVENLNQKYVIEQDDFNDYTQPITRRDFAKLIVRLQERVNNKIMVEGSSQFNDTNDIYISKVKENKLMNGVGDGNFNPYGSLTREQAATIIGRMLPDDLVVTQEYIMYEDDELISDWASNHIQIVSKLGLMEGYDNKFHPQDELTIEQAATLINNFINSEYLR